MVHENIQLQQMSNKGGAMYDATEAAASVEVGFASVEILKEFILAC